MFSQSISKNSLILAFFAFITAATIVFTRSATEDLIEANTQKALEKSLLELVPAESHNNKMLVDKILLERGVLSNRKKRFAYFAFKNDQAVAIVLPATAPDGYGGEIQIVVGIYFNGEISGVRIVTPHNETPGLGDGIEVKKSNWILSFDQKSLVNPLPKLWAVKKDGGEFDQMTGATITPRAVVNAVYNSLVYFEENKLLLLERLKTQQQKSVGATHDYN